MMHDWLIACPPPACPTDSVGARVRLLGIDVDAFCQPNHQERVRRRKYNGLVVTDPDLLSRLLELPCGQPVQDPALWAETTDLQPGIAEHDQNMTVTRLLEPPVHLHDVIVDCTPARRPLDAIREASLFARFARRWVRLSSSPPEAISLEASFLGVGLLDGECRVSIPAAETTMAQFDGWAWSLAEKTYATLSRSAPGHATESQVRSTG